IVTRHASGAGPRRGRAIRSRNTAGRATPARHAGCDGDLPMSKETVRYDDAIVRRFVTATIVWGAVGMLVGLWCALQLAIPQLNFAPYFTFGRLRPLHTNAVIFAFAGNAIFAAVYYSSQRLLKARPLDRLSAIHFWGWQAIIAAAAITLPLGFTQGKE